MDFIYMDNAAGTSIHTAGLKPKKAVEQAREQIANLIGAQPKEIYFTSCGSESNNFAIKGTAWAGEKKGKHIVVSAIDHQSVLNSARSLKRLGWEISTVKVDSKGFVDPEDVSSVLRNDTVVVSVTSASNEMERAAA